ncbi:MAG: hypothetical protein PHQ75_02900 [Thermoguttaceae bacterium]|nr:hypothetical protein [Thermoguttaceae bacterium]
MLNEFKLLAEALERSGFGLEEISPHISDSQCSGLIITHLDNGNLQVEYFNEQRKVWNYTSGNQLAFPKGKISGPFYQTTKEDTEYFKLFKNKEVGTVKKIAKLRELVAKCPMTNDKKWLKKFWKRWREYPKRIADTFLPLLDREEPLAMILTKLSGGSDFSMEGVHTVLAMLAAELLRGCEEGQIPFNLVQPLLVTNTKPDEIVYFHNCNPSVLKDEMKKRFNELIVIQNTDVVHDGICSLTGLPAFLVHGTFPQVNMPVLGQKTVLLAMNKHVLCHERHGRIAADICPVDAKMADKMAAALDQITKMENEGKTWKGVPSSVKNKRDLLIVYCEDEPMIHVNYGNQIASDNIDDDDFDNVEAKVREEDERENLKEQIRSMAQTVIEAVNDVVPDDENKLLRCMILREIDKGRRQIMYADAFTVLELFAATEKWKQAGENIPEINYLFSVQKKVAATKHPACSPSLARTVKLFHTVWGSDLTRPVDIAGISFHEVLGLLLGRRNLKHSPREMLSMLVSRTEHLLCAVGEDHHIRDSEKRKIPVKAKQVTLDVVALFGIFLYKIDEYEENDETNKKVFYKKEQYMKDVYYTLGRFLMLIDHLHVEYCHRQRNGDVPPKLLGNAMIPVANANAGKALARLSERLCPYIGWAKQFINTEPEDAQDNGGGNEKEKGDKRKLIAWLLGQLQQTSELLTKAALPNRRLDDVAKAQLLLGYLSGFEKKQDLSSSVAGTECTKVEAQNSNKE